LKLSPRATGLAAALKEALAIDATLIRGSDGIFDVAVDGEIIFSKDVAGRFPTHTEIIQGLRKRI
jgi:selT/selW/selH-like putative selenoprotein